MPRQKPERKPLTAHQRDRLVAELRAWIVRIERKRDRLARLARYAKMTEEVWSSGSIAFDSMASDINRVLAKSRGEG